ncbi:Uma2 family endonuclease [Limnoraphis robusta]|uniref:Uma2 family endonuclease n=1 Tax=Limnoraphis robusta CCNP1315 TaxID=3110306 RepID=A0ABU5TXP3_9CYAN|nr:Uma2 family endonuclease [Limnoraphis robusta]MEA5519411.1 Uma2 family endonuclease [Limnoraphis robusta CCNP1315]MEA5549133.1 Uma2 family endonuclease [Limnoraphis robusta CCNP1324]
MTIAQDLETLQTEPKFEDIEYPSGDLESQEPPLESELHLRQILLLIQMLEYLWQDRQDFYAFGNLTIYYSPEQQKTQDFRGPDFFVVLNTERKPRKSWVVWEEGGKYPNVIIELLSNSTAKVDRTTKKEIYQDIFRTPDYFWFSPNTLEFQGFHLVDGEYQELQPNETGRLWSQQLQLFLGIHEQKLRFFTPEGELVPTPEESAQTEQLQRQAAEERAIAAEESSKAAQQQLEIERQQKEKLAAKLRELNIDPDTL